MVEINWTFQALEDLSDIADFLAKNYERYATRIVNLILVKVDLLASFPQLGRVVPESNIKSIGELIINNSFIPPKPADIKANQISHSIPFAS